MSVSVQELDNTVRAFFEGKGDVVSPNGHREPERLETDDAQQKQAQQTLTEVSMADPRRDFLLNSYKTI
jgi:exportin-1